MSRLENLCRNEYENYSSMYCSCIGNKIKGSPLVEHFLSENHAPDDFKFCVIYKYTVNQFSHMDIQRELYQKEAFWIHKLQSLTPTGLNANLDLSVFI